MTVWKRPAKVVMKKPAGPGGKKIVRNPAKDKRSKSRWILALVECGKLGGAKKSHKDHTKRISMSLLPRKSDAPRTGPRGKESLLKTMRERLKTESLYVSDEWASTPGAVEAAGSSMLGTCNHSKSWRNPITGIHSNDAESEFARFKLFVRVKYDYMRATNATDPMKKDRAMELKLAEYVFYTNVGREMRHIMAAFAFAGNVSAEQWCF